MSAMPRPALRRSTPSWKNASIPGLGWRSMPLLDRCRLTLRLIVLHLRRFLLRDHLAHLSELGAIGRWHRLLHWFGDGRRDRQFSTHTRR